MTKTQHSTLLALASDLYDTDQSPLGDVLYNVLNDLKRIKQ